MGLRYKLIILVLLQLFSLGIFMVEEEYLMFVCVLLILFIFSVLVVDSLKEWLDSRRLEILMESNRINNKVIMSLENLVKKIRFKKEVSFDISKLLLLERGKKLRLYRDLEQSRINQRKGKILSLLRR